jgi:hypothetical protein
MINANTTLYSLRKSYNTGINSISLYKLDGSARSRYPSTRTAITRGAKMRTPRKQSDFTPSELGPLLERIIGSSSFRRSLRLQRFLRYVTEHAVNNPGQPLKEIELAMGVYDKDASFEPRLDPIVRVEAGRLRLRLLEYYAEAGDEESIIIEIPRGGYIPSFRVLGPERPATGTRDAENPVAYRLCLKGRYFWGKRTAGDLTSRRVFPPGTRRGIGLRQSLSRPCRLLCGPRLFWVCASR